MFSLGGLVNSYRRARLLIQLFVTELLRTTFFFYSSKTGKTTAHNFFAQLFFFLIQLFVTERARRLFLFLSCHKHNHGTST